MSKYYLVWMQLLFLLQLPFLLHAQEVQEPKFGKVSPEEFSMKVYEKDSSAQAVVLFDISDMEFVYDADAIANEFVGQLSGGNYNLMHYPSHNNPWNVSAKVRFKRHARMKILGKQGYGAAEISLPIYWPGGEEEGLRHLRGVTYNQENGVVTETQLDVSRVFKQKDGNYMLYQFTMPDVQEGSVVEFSYELTSGYTANLQPWEYQGEYPVVRSVCRATFPYAYIYKFRKQGNHPFAVQKVVHNLINPHMKTIREAKGTWEVHHISAMKSEPLMAPLRPLLGRMDFQLQYVEWEPKSSQSIAQSWSVVEDKALKESEYFGEYFKGHRELSLVAKQIMGVSTDTLERVGKATALIRERVKWNGRRGVFASDRIGKVLKDGKGNSTTQNLLLLATLRAMGIPSWPLLVPNRQYMPLDPTYADLNAVQEALVLVRMGGGYMVVDASDELLPIGMLPPRCQSGQGWICQGDDKVPWYKLESEKPSQTKVVASFKVMEDGSLSGQVNQQLDGYTAYGVRKEGKITEELVGRMLEPNAGKVSGLQVTHEQDVQKPLHLSYQMAIEPGEKVLLTDRTLDLQPLLAYVEGLDIFKLPQREYPVDLGSPKHYHYTLTFDLPEGYVLRATPAPISISLADKSAHLACFFSQAGNMLSVSLQLQLNKVRYEPQEYGNLREFALRVSTKLQEMVSLQKVRQ